MKLEYKSEAYETYERMVREYNKKPWILVEAWSGAKLNWFQKAQIYILHQVYRIKDYYTNPNRIIARYVNKKIK